MLIGTDHTTNGIINGVQIQEHRLDFPIVYGDYNTIKHQLLYGEYTDESYTVGHSLDQLLNDYHKYNVVPIININAVWWYGRNIGAEVTPNELAYIGKVLNDILKERAFNNYYIALFNEPGKWINTQQVISYANALCSQIGADRVIAGNDEFNMLDWNMLASDCHAKYIGVHPLSSLGNWNDPTAYFHIIKDWRTITSIYGKEIIATEGGSWFRKYTSDEGHDINKRIILECKKYGYKACCIVLADINVRCYKRTYGYRVWDDTFSILRNPTEIKYFEDFINYINIEGEEPTEEDMQLDKYYKLGSKGIGVRFIQKVLNDDIEPDPILITDGIWGAKTAAIVKQYQEKYGLQIDGIVGPQTMKSMIEEYPWCWNEICYEWAVGVR